MTTEQQLAEPEAGTIHFLGVRASFAKAKELLADALAEEPGLSLELREEIEIFLAQFKAANA